MIVRYLVDARGKGKTLDQLYEEYKSTIVGSCVETGKEEIWLRRRLAKRDKRTKEKELKLKKLLKYWKTKLHKNFQRVLRLEIDSGLLESFSSC